MPFAQANGGRAFTDRQSQTVPPGRFADQNGEDNSQQYNDTCNNFAPDLSHTRRKQLMPNGRLRCILVFIRRFNVQAQNQERYSVQH